jgi:hypothetical protein
MTVSISLVARNAACQTIVGLVDAGSAMPNGYIEIRSGTKPSNPQTSPPDGLLLATLSMSNPAFGAPSNGSAVANPIASDNSIDNTGIATWFRIYNRDNGAVIDGTITIVGGGGDLTFDSVNFVKNGTVSITNLTAVMPF